MGCRCAALLPYTYLLLIADSAISTNGGAILGAQQQFELVALLPSRVSLC